MTMNLITGKAGAPHITSSDQGAMPEAHQALYDVIRAAFLAGWRSAGGDPPQEQKLFELIQGGKPLEPPK